MDSRIISIGVIALIIILLVYFLKSDNIISNLIGRIGKIIVFVIIVVLVFILVNILMK